MLKTAALTVSIATAAALLATPALSQTGGRKLQTSLSGAVEVPGPGDTDGRGAATVTVNPGKNQICYTLSVRNIDRATGAHIHEAAPGAAGPVVVPLKAPSTGSANGCVTVARELAMEILKTPSDYYVNVHNAAFPAGAVRGQLAK